MQPHRPDHRSKAARGRLLIRRDLAWLAGYPLARGASGPGWQLMPERGVPERLEIGGEQLHRATRAQRTLWREHPQGLEALLGQEPARWRLRFEALIEALGPVVHASAALPDPWSLPVWSARVRRAARATPDALRPLLESAAWLYWMDEEAAERALSRLHRLGEALLLPGPEGHVRGMRLLMWSEHAPDEVIREVARQLSLDGEREEGPGVRSLTRHQVWTKTLREALDSRSCVWPPAPSPWKKELRRVLDELSKMPREALVRGLGLIALLRPPTEDARDWWTSLFRLEHQLRALPQPPTERGPGQKNLMKAIADQRDQWIQQLEQLEEEAPCGWHTERVADAVLAAAKDAARGDLLLELLPGLPAEAGRDLVADFLVYWTQLEPSGPRLLRQMRRWAATLARTPWPRLKHLWADWFESWAGHPYYNPSPDDDLLEAPEVVVERFYRLVERRPEDIVSERQSRLIELLALTDDGDRALSADKLLPSTLYYPITRLCEAALSVTGWGGEGPSLSGDRSKRIEQIEAFAAVVRWSTPELEPRLHRLPPARVERLGEALALSDGLGLRADPPAALAGDARWVERWPTGLHDALRELAAVHPRAEAAVERLLRDLAPSTARLESEIAALEGMIGAEGQGPRRARLDGLRARLAVASTLDGARLARCEARLREAADQAWLERAMGAAEERNREAIFEQTGLSRLPEGSTGQGLLAVLRGLPDCDGPTRALARRLLTARGGPPPWDLREDPKNRSFLDRMVAIGVDTAPWLELRTRRIERPEPITLALEDDPLEIFLMGERFNTCLSPGQCNFFSVFSNAADINKRLLTARGAQGQLIGRCLLALTDEGSLLSFHPYCHDATLKFGSLVGEYVSELAADMRTLCARFGTVSTLVSQAWYDDGPEYLAGDLPALVEGSPLRAALHTLSAPAALDALREALAPLSLDGRLLPIVIGLDEWKSAPRASLSLLRLAAQRSDLPVDTRMRAAWLALEAGEPALARSLLPEDPPDDALHALFCAEIPASLRLLVRLDPSYLLRILRRAEPKDGYPAEIAFARALAFEALHRPMAARRLFLACAEELWPPERRQEALDRAAKLLRA